MKSMLCIIGIVVPCMAFAAPDCRVVEYPDHFEALCSGNPGPAAPQQPAQGQQVAPPAMNATGGGIPSRRAGRLEQVRSLNSQRYSAATAAAAQNNPETVK